MVDLSKIKGIYLYPDKVNFRMGMPSLTNLILNSYNEKDVIDCLFVFFGYNKNQIKMIEINEDGIWLYNKKLKNSNFIYPDIDGSIKIDKKQLIQILKTIKGKRMENDIKK